MQANQRFPAWPAPAEAHLPTVAVPFESTTEQKELGDIDTWLSMFLDAVSIQAVDAVGRAEQLTDLRERYRLRVQDTTRGSATQLVDLAFEQPVLTSRIVEQRLEITRPSALSPL